MPGILKRHAPKILTAVLLLQAAVFYGFSRTERVPRERPLVEFSLPGAKWAAIRDFALDKETLDVLNADDTLSRAYRNRETGAAADLFVAYFATQRTGKTPHSPKNCLPGTGWTPTESGSVRVVVPGEAEPITINRYVVSRDQSQGLVLYWYQGHNRVVASEYRAKLFTILDSIRDQRSDTSLVRVVVDASDGNIQRAVQTGVSFVRAVFLPLKNYLPA